MIAHNRPGSAIVAALRGQTAAHQGVPSSVIPDQKIRMLQTPGQAPLLLQAERINQRTTIDTDHHKQIKGIARSSLVQGSEM
jgi:hypothetical protein